ncbi:MAG: hypothetical protein M9951_10275 [Burkholderiaceae bacterium]|nr:hypothetical protein [Burkholderiaceae bacterium]
MLRFRLDLQQHWSAVAHWAESNGAIATIDPLTLRLRIARGNRGGTLHPMFVGVRDGRTFYTPELYTDAVGIVGWLPHLNKVWPEASDKAAFKKWAMSVDLRTPRHGPDPSALGCPYLLKQPRSSFGIGIRGPFPASSRSEPGPGLLENEYAEEFVLGSIARAYYWDGRLSVLELYEMPSVTGDGVNSVERLTRALMRPEAELPVGFDELLALQGLHRDSVLPVEQSAHVDYRYVSPLNPTAFGNCNRLRELRGDPILQQFERAGALGWQSVPDAMKPFVIFVLDAIVDHSGVARFLEMNCNPQLHPDLYTPMLDGIFFSRMNDG